MEKTLKIYADDLAAITGGKVLFLSPGYGVVSTEDGREFTLPGPRVRDWSKKCGAVVASIFADTPACMSAPERIAPQLSEASLAVVSAWLSANVDDLADTLRAEVVSDCLRARIAGRAYNGKPLAELIADAEAFGSEVKGR